MNRWEEAADAVALFVWELLTVVAGALLGTAIGAGVGYVIFRLLLGPS